MRVVTIAVDGEKKATIFRILHVSVPTGSEGLRLPKILGETVAPRKVGEEGELNGNFFAQRTFLDVELVISLLLPSRKR
ncbi:hypothetical protein PS647_00650 [Pseudomonas fluorescens]|nr:hypothetical protein PS647_00650 [Pseudomonas fluorescens]